MSRCELPDLAAMQDFGEAIAVKLEAGDVIALSGGLGAGKTTLARAILATLGYPNEVPSPTFTILESYEAPPLRLPVVHADFYRLEHPSEVAELGLDEYCDGAVLIAEWPEKAGGFAHLPVCLSISLEIAGSGRAAIAQGGAAWQRRMP